MEQFRIYLKEKELSPATIEKYVHDVAAFQNGQEKKTSHLQKRSYVDGKTICCRKTTQPQQLMRHLQP